MTKVTTSREKELKGVFYSWALQPTLFFYRERELGPQAEVADDFAYIVKALWSGQYRFITPRDFKVRHLVYFAVLLRFNFSTLSKECKLMIFFSYFSKKKWFLVFSISCLWVSLHEMSNSVFPGKMKNKKNQTGYWWLFGGNSGIVFLIFSKNICSGFSYRSALLRRF